MRLFAAASAALVLLAGGGCGGGESAQDVLRETTSNLGKIRSGQLDAELRFEEKGGGTAGFTLAGPFSLKKGPLVAGELDYSRLGSSGNQTATFISTGQKAYVEIRGQAYELGRKQTAQLRGVSGQIQSGGLAQLDLSDWVVEPRLGDGGEVGGTETDLVRGRLDVPAVVNTLVQLASLGSGGSGEPVNSQDSQALRDAVSSSSASVWTGKDDRLLRKLELRIDFEPTAAPPRIQQLIGVAALFRFAVANPNGDVSVQPPENPKPYSVLGSG